VTTIEMGLAEVPPPNDKVTKILPDVSRPVNVLIENSTVSTVE